MSATLGTLLLRAVPGRLPRRMRRQRMPGRGRHRLAGPPLIALGFTAIVGLLLVTPGRSDAPASVLRARTLDVTTQPDGAVDLMDAATGRLAGHVSGEGDSFIRGVLHSTERMRRVHGVDAGAPYRLTALSNGRLVLEDLGTGLQVDLEAFGQANAGAFAELLAPVAPVAGPVR